MGRGQHTNVIEPPKRTAHNLAYLGESVLELMTFVAVAVALVYARTWRSNLAFVAVVVVAMLVCTYIPPLFRGRFTDRVSTGRRSISTRSTPTEEPS